MALAAIQLTEREFTPRAPPSHPPPTFRVTQRAPRLLSVKYDPQPEAVGHPCFPFRIPTLQTLATLDLSASVTFFAGENGSGKSTLLEALAIALNLPAVGEVPLDRDPTLVEQAAYSRQLKLTWQGAKTRRGFFLRAEDFFGFAKRLTSERAALQRELVDIDIEYQRRSDHARTLRRGPIASSLHEMEVRYGANLDAQSHGQGFLALFASRFVPQGLYVLDEPEAALSPTSQLALLAMIKQQVEEGGSQFIIATHSPLILAYPNARIYSFDASPITSAAYDDLAHVRLTRAFLENPENFLRRL